MIIMGWHGQPRSRLFRLGGIVDVIIERAPCNVVILKGIGNRKFKRILVPIRRGPNSTLALEVASILAEKHDAEIVSFIVNEKNRKIDSAKVSEILSHRPNINHKRIKTISVDCHNTVEAILEEAEKYDLLVLGTTREPLLRQITRDSVSYAVARGCRKPMIIVKASGRIGSWIKRLF